MSSVTLMKPIQPPPERKPDRLTEQLSSVKRPWFTLYASVCAFGLYTSIYAFRKTFAAATYNEHTLISIDAKVWFVIFQVCGYALSKFIGIKLIAELRPQSRRSGVMILSLLAFAGWFLFAWIPFPYNLFCMFVNGLALGLIWGITFSYLEGRETTEVLGAALSASFIFSSGLCRTVGAWLMQSWQVTEYWMPFVASCIFITPLAIFTALLDKVPPPTSKDEQLRARRLPMSKSERKKFVATFLPGIILFILAYMLLTAYRDFRDNFSAEIWNELGHGTSPTIYTSTEIPVAIGVMAAIGAVMLVRSNLAALIINHIIIIAGLMLIGASTWLFEAGFIRPSAWMTLIGLGLYLGYVPFNSIFFDRIIAAFQYVATTGFIMYVADAFGYLGSVAVMFFRQFGRFNVSWLQFMIYSGYVISFTATALMAGSMAYFYVKHKREIN